MCLIGSFCTIIPVYLFFKLFEVQVHCHCNQFNIHYYLLWDTDIMVFHFFSVKMVVGKMIGWAWNDICSYHITKISSYLSNWPIVDSIFWLKKSALRLCRIIGQRTQKVLVIQNNWSIALQCTCTIYNFHNSTDTLKFWTEKRTIT